MKIIHRNKFQRFLLRLHIAWKILFRKKHIIVLYPTTQDIVHLIKSEPEKIYKTDIDFAGLMKHQCCEILLRTAQMVDNTEIICDKALFEVAVTEKINKKNTDKK